ncbi:MAG: methylmalonyl-CoA mutase [Acidimicrobiia bacterium]|nr:methylmalonyl-CoA mutase [Acidimicrobiia bacterium]NND12788.1 methylmalonyl-CoA mutase [Acidimicrobiia bacterium]NNL28820.1 methylmalonyl-CoA mutase [Acidimicrobiia bacterium]
MSVSQSANSEPKAERADPGQDPETDGPQRTLASGIELPVVSEPTTGVDEKIGRPGEYPYTRGAYPTMYRGRPWTMRQYAGFGSAAETNRRFLSLLEAGQTGLSVAFDLPTQMGLDSDDPRAAGEVGKVGVAIDTIHDMRTLFADIPLGEVTTSMTINATAPMLLLLYQLVAEEQGADLSTLGGTIQNDILKEYVARGTYIYPPAPSMRLVTDVFAYCGEVLPTWNTISISGYHIREAGSTATQEIAYTLSNALAYVEAARSVGLDVDDFAPRLSFFWNSHNHFLEEIAKFRAARRMWADLMRNRVGARNPESWRMRFHTQTAGSSLTAQQPHNNVVRTTVQAMAAILGGTQSLHTNSFDEALGLPTEAAARLALRTQQILANESGLTDSVDPLAGSYLIEWLTDEMEQAALAIMADIDELGGAVGAIEAGYMQAGIEEASYAHARGLDEGDIVVVGVNAYADDGSVPVELLTPDPAIEREQVDRLGQVRAGRIDVVPLLKAVEDAARTGDSVMHPIKAALAAEASVGEVAASLRSVFGSY